MKIQSIIERAGGSSITLGLTEYKFVPQADGAHVCEVENEDHQDRLLAIAEGFKMYRPKKAAAPAKVEQDDDGGDEQDESDKDDEKPSAATREAYKAKFGKYPHHMKSLETILAELEA